MFESRVAKILFFLCSAIILFASAMFLYGCKDDSAVKEPRFKESPAISESQESPDSPMAIAPNEEENCSIIVISPDDTQRTKGDVLVPDSSVRFL